MSHRPRCVKALERNSTVRACIAITPVDAAGAQETTDRQLLNTESVDFGLSELELFGPIYPFRGSYEMTARSPLGGTAGSGAAGSPTVSPVSPTAFPAASFLGGLAAADLEALRAAARVRRYRSGELLLREGDAPRAVLAILAGTVKLTKTATSGREAVPELRGAGGRVGELGAIDGQ